jgi:alpha-beta hydrolase superfamily lysophospholipase
MTEVRNHHTPERRHHRSRAAVAVAALMALVMLAAACSSDDNATGDAAAGTSDTAADASVGIDYSAFGPFSVGWRSIEVEGVEVEVLYPVDTDRADEGERVESISSALAFPESLRAVITEAAPFLIQELPVDVYRDAPVAADGPFGVVLYSHGASGHPSYYINTLAHTASWGYVVAAPNHPSRNLAAAATGGGADAATTDVEDLTNTVESLNAINADPDDPMHLSIDTAQLAAAGHSAGGGAISRMAMAGDVAGTRLSTIIGQAPAPPVRLSTLVDPDATDEERQAAINEALGAQTPPDLPVLLVAGERDGVIPLATVEANYQWLTTPKQLVVMANAGHNPVLDVCATIRAQGGLTAAAGGLAQAFGPNIERLLALGEDGCVEGFLEPEAGYAVTRHLTVAQVRWAFGQDPGRASLDQTFLVATFGDAIGPVLVDL